MSIYRGPKIPSMAPPSPSSKGQLINKMPDSPETDTSRAYIDSLPENGRVFTKTSYVNNLLYKELVKMLQETSTLRLCRVLPTTK